MLNPYETRDVFVRRRVCAIVPTYNNAGTVIDVLDRLHFYIADIIVVNDGSTDQTATLVEQFIVRLGQLISNTHIHLVSLSSNQGKGSALVAGFGRAISLGFQHAVTIDADGQHYPEDLPLFAERLEAEAQQGKSDHTLLVGTRQLPKQHKGWWARQALRLSSFCFMLQTWQHLSDLQSGYRLYPLFELRDLDFITSRFEAELELLILSAWHGVKLRSLPIRVYYPPQEQSVSHFRPLQHFGRVVVLNTLLLPITLLYGWPLQIFHRLMR